MNRRAIIIAGVTACLASGGVSAQTTRTNPSAASTIRSIPSSSSTSPNSPCSPNNPSSPCYSANAPRNPCYSALTPNEPCSTTTTPSSQPAPAASPSPTPGAKPNKQLLGAVLTLDQAKARIEEAGYSSVSALRKDLKGGWRANAVKDGQTVMVTLDSDGKLSSK